MMYFMASWRNAKKKNIIDIKTQNEKTTLIRFHMLFVRL